MSGAQRGQENLAPGPTDTHALPRLDIVIVNWNTGSYLRDCLASVAAATRTSFELGTVVVVDNASSDGSLEALDGRLELPLQVVRNTTNRGFAAACNQGARLGSGELVLFLNPDTRLFPETLERSVAFMLDPAHADIGICGVRNVNEEGVEEFSACRFPTLWMWLAKMVGLSQAFPRWIATQRLDSSELERSGIVDQVIGAYMLIPRPLFRTLEGFDERFFVYLEDVDLAYRSTQCGRPCYFMADVPLSHVGRISSNSVRGKRLFYLLRGRTEFARKHWPAWQGAVLGAMILTVELPVRWLLALATGQRDELRNVSEASYNYARYLLLGRRATERATSNRYGAEPNRFPPTNVSEHDR